jgi:predicted alpha/beta superfamily hydrolase
VKAVPDDGFDRAAWSQNRSSSSLQKEGTNNMRARRYGRAVGSFVLLAAIVAGGAGTAAGQAPAAKKDAAVPAVELPGTQMLALHSTVTGQDYVLHVGLPAGYDGGSSRFPVIYSVDGQWDFTLVQAIYGQQYYDGFLPGAIVVGITWGGEKPDYDKRRAFDLTPTPAGQPGQYGNAPKFLEFIQKEVVPFVDARYRTSVGERTLTGSSFGGLFTLYALFHQPGLFNRYVLTSPSWQWDNRVLFADGERFAKAPLPRPIKVFMGVGEYEDVAGFEKLAATMRGYEMAGLDLQTKVILGAGHAGAKTEGFTRGLQFVFSRPCATLSPEALQRLVGEYLVTAPPVTVRIAAEDGRLVALPPDGGRMAMCADSDTDFHAVGQFLKVHFIQEPDKAVSGFRVELFAGEMVATRKK